MVYSSIIDTLLASKIFFPLRNQNLVEHKLSVTLHYTILTTLPAISVKSFTEGNRS